MLGLLSLRGRERDSAIGAVLAFGLGLGVLFLSLYQGYATEATNLLFGSIVGVSDASCASSSIVGAIVLAGLAALYRPLLFSSVDPEVAEARGVPLRALSVAIFLLLALDDGRGDPGRRRAARADARDHARAAAAQRLTARPGLALLLSVAIALVSTEGGILLSLEKPWPTSFFISAISFAFYVAARLYDWNRGRQSRFISPPPRRHWPRAGSRSRRRVTWSARLRGGELAGGDRDPVIDRPQRQRRPELAGRIENRMRDDAPLPPRGARR